MVLYYIALKTLFLFALVKAFTAAEPLQKHWAALAALYTAALAFLSWVFILAPNTENPSWRYLELWVGNSLGLISPAQPRPTQVWRAWMIWLAETFALAALYFRLLARFDEGLMFWVVLLAGLGLIIF
ncbi:MAG: hypothetical protein U0800_26540 [Isosphaeraceae bacterium]